MLTTSPPANKDELPSRGNYDALSLIEPCRVSQVPLLRCSRAQGPLDHFTGRNVR
jgi:hypothetical protein